MLPAVTPVGTPRPATAPTAGPQAGLAQRILLALSESEFAATIGELKRQMDRQSQLFLQEEEQAARAGVSPRPAAPSPSSAPPPQPAPVLVQATPPAGLLVDLSGGDSARPQAPARTEGSASSPRKRAHTAPWWAVDDIGDVGLGGGDDATPGPGNVLPAPSPALAALAAATAISISRPQTPPETPPGPTAPSSGCSVDEQSAAAAVGSASDAQKPAEHGVAKGQQATASKRDSNQRPQWRTSPPPLRREAGIARSGTVTLSSRKRRDEVSLAPASPYSTRRTTTTRTVGRGRPVPVKQAAAAKQATPARRAPPRPPAAQQQQTPAAPRQARQAPRPAPPPPPPPVAGALPPPPSGGKGAAGSRPSPRSMASRRSGTSSRVPSQATFVKPPACPGHCAAPSRLGGVAATLSAPLHHPSLLPRLRRPRLLLHLPVKALVHVFSFLGRRERTLPVCRRWVDLGLRAELWTSIAFDARGTRNALCRRLEFTRALQRLHIADRHDVNHILETALRACLQLSHLRLERCRGPGPVVHCGTFTPRSVVILDTPVSSQLVELLANIAPTMEECTISSNVEQAAALFCSLLKMALVADGKVPEQLETLEISFGSTPAAAPGQSTAGTTPAKPTPDVVGTLRWRRQGLNGTMTYNRVSLTAAFAKVNF